MCILKLKYNSQNVSNFIVLSFLSLLSYSIFYFLSVYSLLKKFKQTISPEYTPCQAVDLLQARRAFLSLYIYILYNIAAYISLYLFIYCNIQHYIYLYISLCTIFISLYTVSVYLLFHLVIFPFVYLTLFSLSDLIFSVRPYFLYSTLFSLSDLIFSI